MYGSNSYGSILYAGNNINEEEISAYAPNLMQYLPTYYNNSKVMQNIQDSNSKEIGSLKYSQWDLLNQFFIDTATWGLTYWEKEYGIETNLNKSYEERREILKAKKRGQGTVTKIMMKNVAKAFSGGEVDVIENSKEYNFIIQFIGIKGIPKNMQGLIDMIEIIKPAHLGYSFKYTFTVWDLIEKNNTWNNIKLKTWNDLKVYE